LIGKNDILEAKLLMKETKGMKASLPDLLKPFPGEHHSKR